MNLLHWKAGYGSPLSDAHYPSRCPLGVNQLPRVASADGPIGALEHTRGACSNMQCGVSEDAIRGTVILSTVRAGRTAV